MDNSGGDILPAKDSTPPTKYICAHCPKPISSEARRVKHEKNCPHNPACRVEAALKGMYRCGSKKFDCLFCTHVCGTEGRAERHVRTKHKSSVRLESKSNYYVSQSGLNLIFTNELVKNRGVFANFEKLSKSIKLLDKKHDEFDWHLRKTCHLFEKKFANREEFHSLCATVNTHSLQIEALMKRMNSVEQKVGVIEKVDEMAVRLANVEKSAEENSQGLNDVRVKLGDILKKLDKSVEATLIAQQEPLNAIDVDEAQNENMEMATVSNCLTFGVSKANLDVAAKFVTEKNYTATKLGINNVGGLLGAMFLATHLIEKLQVKCDMELLESDYLPKEYVIKVIGVPGTYGRQNKKDIFGAFVASHCHCRIVSRYTLKSAFIDINIHGLDQSKMLAVFIRKTAQAVLNEGFQTL